MATWSEVKNFIKSNYRIQSETDGTLTLVFDSDGGRSQLVIVMGIEGAGELSSARFFSPFARVDQITPSQFANLAQASIFGLAAVGDYYGLVHTALLENLDASEITTPLAFITGEADGIERNLGLGDDL